jgi:hypothetical protein
VWPKLTPYRQHFNTAGVVTGANREQVSNVSGSRRAGLD